MSYDCLQSMKAVYVCAGLLVYSIIAMFIVNIANGENRSYFFEVVGWPLWFMLDLKTTINLDVLDSQERGLIKEICTTLYTGAKYGICIHNCQMLKLHITYYMNISLFKSKPVV